MTRTTSILIPHARTLAMALLAGVFAACGSSPTSPGSGGTGGGGGGGGSTNRAPVVSATASATFGIAQLTTFSFNSSTSDPDGDAVTVSWNFGDGTAASGNSATHTYTAGGTYNVVATASDSKGASTPSSNVTVTVGGMTGTWTGTINLSFCLPGVTKTSAATLTQAGGIVTGTVTLPQGLCSFAPGTAVTDPAEPGTISATGAVRIRVKIPPFTDVYFQGQMDSSGRTISGGLVGSGHNGTPFVWNKQ